MESSVTNLIVVKNNNVQAKFVGFTEGVSPFGHVPVVEVQVGERRVLMSGAGAREVLSDSEWLRMVDAGHAWNNSGPCDDHLLMFNPSISLSE